MIEKFGIAVFAEQLNEAEKTVVIRGFSEFYYDQTPKHQKRIKLDWMQSNSAEMHKDLELMKAYDVTTKMMVHDPMDTRTHTLQSTSIVVHPSTKNCKTVLSESFSYGNPVIAKQSEYNKEHITMSCGLLLNGKSNEQLVCEIVEVLDMLYHDSGVIKILGKGALSQYEEKFGWGLREFRRRSMNR